MKRSRSPPEIRRRGPISGHTRRSTSRKVQHGDMGHSLGDSYGKETDNCEGSSSRKTSSHSQRKGKKRKHSKVMTLESSRNPNHPLSMERLRKGKRQKFGHLV
jgi:hypothetical protein